jgi:dihydrofolate reductase
MLIRICLRKGAVRAYNSISIIVAVADDNVIGYKNRIPWTLPADLTRFKELTWGGIVVMGRRTYESIGQPLPGRINVVITRGLVNGDIKVVKNIEEFFSLIKNNDWSSKSVFVLGGTEIYECFLPRADKIHMTRIYESFKGDTYFPELDLNQWELTSKETGIRNDENPHHYEYRIYRRKL